MTADRVVPLSYFVRIPNVGDRANADLVEALTGTAVMRVADSASAHLMAAGSIMAAASPRSIVWGTGVMGPEFGIGAPTAENIHALRGKLSASAVRDAGLTLRDVPLGDPGFLLPAVLGIERASRPIHRLGLVAHYVDRGHSAVRGLLKEEGVADLDVHSDPVAFLSAMAQCGVVVSTSLHGLVFAEALGVPNVWAQASPDVAGDGFKFRDWFSTTALPQTEPVKLREGAEADLLAVQARLHESLIDTHDLTAAFPHEAVSRSMTCKPEGFVPASDCRKAPTPVFMISFNRGEMLERTCAAVEALEQPVTLVVHDNGSDDPATLEILDRLETRGVQVVRRGKIANADDLNAVDATVADFFSRWAEPQPYVVSDCDVDISTARADVLAIYSRLLNRFRRSAVVGPMLTIDDIPGSYPLYNRVMNRHIEQFWGKRPELIDLDGEMIALQEAMIDTTFALHRAGEPFRRMKSGLRVYAPFQARHLDWYETSSSDGGVYARTSGAAISHWNNEVERRAHEHDALAYETYTVVNVRDDGSLSVEERHPIRNTVLKPGGAVVPPLASASAAEIETRLAEVEALRRNGASEIERWSEPASHHDNWRERGRLLAALVRPGEAVLEFGAGYAPIRAFLPPEQTYIGSDLNPRSADLTPYDLNASELAPLPPHDVAIFSGVLEYVHDLAKLLDKLRKTTKAIVCSYACRQGETTQEHDRRRYSGWFTDFDEGTLVDFFRQAGFQVAKRTEWNAQAVFRFEREA